MVFFLEVFYENGALEELIRLFNSETCPDPQHVLETILVLSNAKPDAMSTLVERDSTLMEQFQQKVNDRRQIVQNSEEQQVSYLSKIQRFYTHFALILG